MTKRRRLKWSNTEDEWLMNNAGRFSRKELARQLRRSENAISQRTKRLKQSGRANVSLRSWNRRTIICPSCGARRSSLKDNGVCKPCDIRDRIKSVEKETGEIMRKLPPDARERYRSNDTKLHSRVDPEPKKRPIDHNASAYETIKQEDLNAIEAEAWEVRNLERKLKARSRRLQRMKKHIKPCEDSMENQ